MTRKSSRMVRPKLKTFSRDEIVIRLIEQGVPRWKAEKTADEQVVKGLAPALATPRRIKATNPKGMSVEAIKFRVWCKDNGLPMPHVDYRFDSETGSAMEIDYAWPEEKVGLESQGGIWRNGGGAHQGKGHIRDMRKLNRAQELGWHVLQCVPDDLFSPLTLDMVRRALESRAVAAPAAQTENG